MTRKIFNGRSGDGMAFRLAALCLILSLALCGQASATDKTWDSGGGADTKWTTGANWNDDTAPSGTDYEVYIDNGGTASIGASETLTLTYGVTVGHSTTGNGLNITGGGALNNDSSWIGGRDAAGAAGGGTVTVSGAGSSWTMTTMTMGGDLTVGNSGTGVLNIEDGGEVTNSGNARIGASNGSSGTVTVTGAGSVWENDSGTNDYNFYVGGAGTGALNITNGGKVISKPKALVRIGNAANGNGTVTVDGVGSVWEISIYDSPFTIHVGNTGTGVLNIKNGGKVDTTGTNITVGGGNVGKTGTINIGAAAGDSAADAGVLDAPGINGGYQGTVQFNHTGTDGAPYYFTRNGTGTGAGIALLINGNFNIVNTNGYTVLTGTDSRDDMSSGTTTINGGTLQIGDGGTTGNIKGNIANNAALIFNRSGALTYGGAISGTGTLEQKGAGTLTLSGANTYTGDTTVGAGGLTITGSYTIPSGATFTVESGATLTLASGATLTVAPGGTLDNGTGSTVTGSGTINLAPSGTITDEASLAGTLTVNTVNVPDAPTIGTATAGNGQAIVAFTAPANNGGSQITGYTATSNPGNITATGASGPITVTGLSNGTAYTFTVTATNIIGTSAPSAESNMVTPSDGGTPPPPPPPGPESGGGCDSGMWGPLSIFVALAVAVRKRGA